MMGKKSRLKKEKREKKEGIQKALKGDLLTIFVNDKGQLGVSLKGGITILDALVVMNQIFKNYLVELRGVSKIAKEPIKPKSGIILPK